MEDWSCPKGGKEHIIEDVKILAQESKIAIICQTCGKTYKIPDKEKVYLPRRNQQIKEFLKKQLEKQKAKNRE